MYLKITPFFIILFLFIAFAMNLKVLASGTNQKIYDFAELLTLEEKKEFEEIASKYSEKREIDIIILTTNNTKDKDIVKYMKDFYNEKALGYDKPHGNCAILTIDVQHRGVYLAGFYKGEEYLDNSRCDLIRKKITPDLLKKNYYDAFKYFIETSYKYMGIKPGVNPDNILFELWFQITTSIVVGAVTVGIMAYNLGGRVTVTQSTYLDANNSGIIQKRDDYIRTLITKKRKSKTKNESSIRSEGGDGGISSGGHSHSGSRGSF
ncbi:hypothetical protein OR62_09795 [Clostridium tetani]|nr:hypothetical protein OR62_09795 [Clostridium tetani]